jgi:hypothetical protein
VRRALQVWWVQVLLVSLAARLFGVVVFLAVARTQAENPWTPADPTYLDYTGTMWDATWYRHIAESGYPHTLPVAPDGRVAQNAWAFFPLFPSLVRAVMAVTGGTWVVLAPLIALALGLLAMLVVHAVTADALARADVDERAKRWGPLLTVALLSTSASAPVLQVAYTESAALLGVATVLWTVQRRRYALAALAVVAVGLTRAVALPLAAVVVVHGISRLRAARRSDEPHEQVFPRRSRVAVGGLAVLAVAAGFAWPMITERVTGVPGAYELTQGAWRGRGEVVPLLPWLDVARWLFHGWAIPVLALLAALTVVGLASPWLRLMGAELHAWVVAYLLYLVGVLEPGTSLVRFAILAFPAWGALAVRVLYSRRPRTWTWILVLLGLVGQVAWVGLLWRLVPPSGWPP